MNCFLWLQKIVHRWSIISSACYNFGRNLYWRVVCVIQRKIIHFSCLDSRASRVLLYIYKLGFKQPHDLRIMPFQWMDQSIGHRKWLLHAGGNAMAYGPHYFDDIQAFAAVRIPDVYCHNFTNARISSTSSSVVLNDSEAIIERAVISGLDNFVYKAGHIVAHRSKTAIVQLGDVVTIEKGIFLGGNGSFNYYHWMIEILPKLQFLSDLPEQFKKYPLLVSEYVEQIPAFKTTISIFAPGRELISLKKNFSYSVGNLIYIDSPSNLPFNLRKGEKFGLSYSLISGDSVRFVKNRIFARLKTDFKNSNHAKRLFFSRKCERRKYNKNDVLECLAKFGFEEVFMEDISFEKQVALMHNAELVVGPSGAVWTNLIFCRPGTKGLCWMAEEIGDFSAFSTIAHLVDVDLTYITYRSGVHSSGELYDKEYIVDVALIERYLTVLIA